MNKQTRRFGWGKRAWLTILILLILIPATIWFFRNIGGRTYYLVSLLIIVYTMFPFFLVFEKRKPQARELVVLAVLCALAVASRAAFKNGDKNGIFQRRRILTIGNEVQSRRLYR